MLIFICGPYSGSTTEKISKHIDAARKVAVKMAGNGIQFICPHLNSAHFEELTRASEQYWCDMYLEILRRCDGLFKMRGWMGSTRCVKEAQFARDWNIPCFVSIKSILSYEARKIKKERGW